MENLDIRIIVKNKKDFLPLLLLGDESESQIDKYLERKLKNDAYTKIYTRRY